MYLFNFRVGGKKSCFSGKMNGVKMFIFVSNFHSALSLFLKKRSESLLWKTGTFLWLASPKSLWLWKCCLWNLFESIEEKICLSKNIAAIPSWVYYSFVESRLLSELYKKLFAKKGDLSIVFTVRKIKRKKYNQLEVFIEYSADPQVPVGAEHKGSKAKIH